MTGSKLESPAVVDDLYLARDVDVPQSRPIVTGDIFRGVPLHEADCDRAVVLTHPCSMRKDGVRLADRLLVAPVVESTDPIPLSAWTGHFKVMPLPDLEHGAYYSARFLDIETVDSEQLSRDRRIAVLHPRGVNLLLQRLVHHMSRVVVETGLFEVACGQAFAEVDIVEEWTEAAMDAGIDIETAAVGCHDWLREEESDGHCPQERLRDAQARSAVRRAARRAMQEWVRGHHDPASGHVIG